MKKLILLISVFTLLFVGCSNDTSDKKEVNVYTDRHYEVDKEIFKEFEEETGIKVNIVELESAEVFSKLSTEKDAVADLVIMTGAEYIYKLNENDLLKDHGLTPNADENYYGKNWIGIAARSRSVAISNNSDITITSYADLANSNLKDQILVRSSSNSYNQAWVASQISLYGEEKTSKWLEGFVGNFARVPEGNDRDQVKAVNGGDGSVAIVNSYYMNRLNTSSEISEVEASKNVTLANLDEIHLNVSFAALVDDNEYSIELLKYLESADVQTKISLENGEYPINNDSEVNPYIESIQTVNAQDLDYETFGMYVERAYELMIKAGWE